MNQAIEHILNELNNFTNEELIEIEKTIHILYHKNKKRQDIKKLTAFQCNGKIREFSRQDAYVNRI